MDEFEFKLTWKNVLIFIVAMALGTIVSTKFHSPFTGLFIILGAAWYLVRKRS